MARLFSVVFVMWLKRVVSVPLFYAISLYYSDCSVCGSQAVTSPSFQMSDRKGSSRASLDRRGNSHSTLHRQTVRVDRLMLLYNHGDECQNDNDASRICSLMAPPRIPFPFTSPTPFYTPVQSLKPRQTRPSLHFAFKNRQRFHPRNLPVSFLVLGRFQRFDLARIHCQ